MKVLILASGAESGPGHTGERPPTFLLPLIDRPFLQHVIESIADAGIADTVDVVISHMPERVESLLGDGTRWGLKVHYHLVREASQPYGILSTLAKTGESLLLVHADCLPLAEFKEIRSSPVPVVYRYDGRWAGWAYLDAATAAGIQPAWDREQVERWITETVICQGAVIDCAVWLGAGSEAEFLASQRVALHKQFPRLMFNGREIDENVWMARNVSLHPTATLIPPVYLGENCRIGAGVRLGPNAVVVRDCILDRGTTVADSAILPGSYVGQELELDHVIVDRNRLINVKAGGEIVVTDDFILSGITRTSFLPSLAGLLSRAAALLLLACTWPLLLVTALSLRLTRRGPVVRSVQVVRLPASGNQWEWKTFQLSTFAVPGSRQTALAHFCLRVLPGLISVIRGELDLVGVAPRSPEEISALPPDWRTLYLRARAGLIEEAYANYGQYPSADEIYSSEAYYSVAAGPRHDGAILLRYAARMFERGPKTRSSDMDGASLNPK